jgi:hypothetical protein
LQRGFPPVAPLAHLRRDDPAQADALVSKINKPLLQMLGSPTMTHKVRFLDNVKALPAH